MIRFLIIAALVWVVYRALRSFTGHGLNKPIGRSASGEIDDIMVQDPVCGVYFPVHQGISVRQGGEILHFCSEQCRDRYQKKP